MVAVAGMLAQLALGTVFMVAGIGKRLERPDLIEQAHVEYAFLSPPLAHFYGRLLPWLEIATGLLLLLGSTLLNSLSLQIVGLLLAMTLLLAFSVTVGIMLARGQQAECHCFGRFGGGRVTRWTFGRNLVLMALGVVAFFDHRAASPTLRDSSESIEIGPVLLLSLAALATIVMLVRYFAVRACQPS